MLVSQSIVHLFPFSVSVYSPPFFLSKISATSSITIYSQKMWTIGWPGGGPLADLQFYEIRAIIRPKLPWYQTPQNTIKIGVSAAATHLWWQEHLTFSHQICPTVRKKKQGGCKVDYGLTCPFFLFFFFLFFLLSFCVCVSVVFFLLVFLPFVFFLVSSSSSCSCLSSCSSCYCCFFLIIIIYLFFFFICLIFLSSYSS